MGFKPRQLCSGAHLQYLHLVQPRAGHLGGEWGAMDPEGGWEGVPRLTESVGGGGSHSRKGSGCHVMGVLWGADESRGVVREVVVFRGWRGPR